MINEKSEVLDILHTEEVKAGSRIYYFDVKATENGDRYIVVTESKKVKGDSPQIVRSRIRLYAEDFVRIKDALLRVMSVVSEASNVTKS